MFKTDSCGVLLITEFIHGVDCLESIPFLGELTEDVQVFDARLSSQSLFKLLQKMQLVLVLLRQLVVLQQLVDLVLND